jgi:hypothetical protein
MTLGEDVPQWSSDEFVGELLAPRFAVVTAVAITEQLEAGAAGICPGRHSAIK